jgi:hypothetical protein
VALAGVFFPAKQAKYSKSGFWPENLTLGTFFTTKERREREEKGWGRRGIADCRLPIEDLGLGDLTQSRKAAKSQRARHAFPQTSLGKRGSPGGEQPESLMGVIFEP